MNKKCQFCGEFSTGSIHKGQSRIIKNGDEFVLFPTLGCFCEGYCLYIPKDHARSFSECASNALYSAGDELRQLRQIIASEFNNRVILAEHGPKPRSDTPDDENGPDCSCVDHAHIHVIPVPDVGSVLQRYVMAGGPPTALDSFLEIQQFSGPYIYLSIPSVIGEESRHMIWSNTQGFQKQFVRKVCADLYAIGSFYNWRKHPFENKMRETRRRLLPYFSDRQSNTRKPRSLSLKRRTTDRWPEQKR